MSFKPAARSSHVYPALRDAIDRSLYKWNPGSGVYQADNPAQRLAVQFRGGEVRLEHPQGSAAFRLKGYGYGNRLSKPSPGRPSAEANRLTIRRGVLTEWYVNQSGGLEQGFTIAQRPTGVRARGPLLIELEVTGGLRPRLEQGSAAVLLESKQGAVLRYAGVRSWDAQGHAVPSRIEIRGRQIRLVVEDGSAQYPLVVDPVFTQQAELTASDGAANDEFGFSVAVDGTTAVVGAPGHKVGSSSQQGTAYVFVYNGSSWVQEAELTASDGAAGDNFGFWVAVSGTTALVGAPYHLVGSNSQQGTAYVFTYNGSGWVQQAELTGSDGAAGDNFGDAVAVSGSTVVVGAEYHQVGSNSQQGTTYVFTYNGSDWVQQPELTASDGATCDNFGDSVSASGTTVAIGAPGHQVSSNTGAAYVFAYNGSSWVQAAELTSSAGGYVDGFGDFVAVSGTTLVVTAPQHKVGSSQQGAAYVFAYNGSNWVQQAELTASDGASGDFFGFSAALSGTTVVVGAAFHEVGSNVSQGAAYVFTYDGSNWIQYAELIASDGASSDDFGFFVAVSGATALVGTPAHKVGSNVSQGTAYVFAAQPASGTAPPPPLILTAGSLPQAFADEPYTAGVSASGGIPPYTFGAGGLPPGIGINQYSGIISGQTTQAGTFTVTLSVTDSSGASAASNSSLTVVPPPPVSLSGGSLGSVVAGSPVSLTIAAAGGAPPYSYALTGGAPPPGLALSPGGTLHGVPVTSGSYAFTVKATDSSGGSASGSFSMAILPPPPTINSPSPLATGVVTIGYPTQSLTATGGTAPYTFAITQGSLPAELTLSSTGMISGTPTAATPPAGTSFTVMATDSSTPASTDTATFSIAVQPFTQNIVLSAGSLAFTSAAGSMNLPPAQTVGVQATMVNQSVSYIVAVNPASATWLSAASGSNTPGLISIGLTQAALSLTASTTPYTASVIVTCTSTSCSGKTQTLGVSLTVSSPPPSLSVQLTPLSFSTTASAPQVLSQSLAVSNTGGGSIGFESISCGAPWCTVGGVPGSLGASASVNLTVTVDPTGLSAGYYYTAVGIVSSVGSASVPVTFSIAPNGVISLSPAGAEFTLPQGGQLPPGSFLVDITGSAAVNYSAAVAPGAPFLNIVNGNGSASGMAPGTVTYAFDNLQISQLQAGTYYATISVAAGGASNSPQSWEVVLDVTPATTPTVPTLAPGGLIFLTQATVPPPAQTITVTSFSTASTAFQASASTNAGGNWLSATPTTGSTVAGTPGTVSVTVNPSGLNPGVYQGAVNFAFGGTTAVRSVNVTLVVENAGSATAPALSNAGHPDATGACTPSQLVPTSTGLVSNFAAPAAWPVPLGITLVDDCGNLVNNGQIVATFSNGDPPLILTLGDPTMASYVGTWTPEHASPQIVIDARASAPSFTAATARIAGAVTPNNAPILADLAIANFYNPIGGAPLAPGALVQITGQYLSGQTVNATSIPLPLTLGGTSVIIGGVQAPLSMVSPGQVNAQVPFELPAGQPYQVIANANNALTTPRSFQAGAASPGLSVLPSGYVNASHQNGTAVTDAVPAKPGESISIYLVGMGSTTIPVSSGNPGPGSPFATTTIHPVIAVNGENAVVSFSGLIPGLVGVYQVNFTVPSDAPDGDLKLLLAENAFASNSALLPVHN